MRTKLIINKQKLAANSLIDEMRDSSSLHELGILLERSQLTFHPESEQISNAWYWPDQNIASDGWYKGSDRPQSYLYEALAAHVEVVNKISCMTFLQNVEASCHLYFGSSYPIFELATSLVEPFVVQLAQKFDLGFAIVEKQNQFGLIVSHYIGYLEGKITDDETVYEVTTWT